jgi:hypothetical protein
MRLQNWMRNSGPVILAFHRLAECLFRIPTQFVAESLLVKHGFLSIFLREANCRSNTNTLCDAHGEGGISSKGFWFARIRSKLSPPERSLRRRQLWLRRRKPRRRPRSRRPDFSARRERSRRLENVELRLAERLAVLRPSGRMKVRPLCFLECARRRLGSSSFR